MSTATHLELSNVGISFPTDQGLFCALQNVNLKIDQGEFKCIDGASRLQRDKVSQRGNFNELHSGYPRQDFRIPDNDHSLAVTDGDYFQRGPLLP